MDKHDVIAANIKHASDLVIENGNKFPGYFGEDPEYFTKPELILLCNILHDQAVNLRKKLSNCKAKSILF